MHHGGSWARSPRVPTLPQAGGSVFIHAHCFLYLGILALLCQEGLHLWTSFCFSCTNFLKAPWARGLPEVKHSFQPCCEIRASYPKEHPHARAHRHAHVHALCRKVPHVLWGVLFSSYNTYTCIPNLHSLSHPRKWSRLLPPPSEPVFTRLVFPAPPSFSECSTQGLFLLSNAVIPGLMK